MPLRILLHHAQEPLRYQEPLKPSLQVRPGLRIEPDLINKGELSDKRKDREVRKRGAAEHPQIDLRIEIGQKIGDA